MSAVTGARVLNLQQAYSLFSLLGAAESDFKHASERSLAPEKLMADGLSMFVLETELPLLLSEWAAKAAIMNGGRKKAEAKI